MHTPLWKKEILHLINPHKIRPNFKDLEQEPFPPMHCDISYALVHAL